MSVTVKLHTLLAFATGLAVALVAVLVFQSWRADAAPGDVDTTFVPITPCRLIDTRPAPNRVGPNGAFGIDDTKTIQAHGTNGDCAIPTDATGLSLNVTAVNAAAPTFLTVWPGGDRPQASSLNPFPGAPPTPNAVTSSLSGAGSFDIYNRAGSVNVIVDINGYHTRSSLQELAARVTALEAAVPVGIDFVHEPGSPIDVSVSANWSDLRDVMVSHPGPGFVTCHGIAHMDYDSTESNLLYLGWGTDAGAVQPPSFNYVRALPPVAEDRRIALSAMYTFEVGAAGDTVFYLKTRTDSVVPTAFDASFHGLTCTYVATRL